MNATSTPAPLELNSDDLLYLKLLAIFHYIGGALVWLMALLGVGYVIFGSAILLSPESLPKGRGEPPEPFLGLILLLFGLFFMLGGAIFGSLLIYSGRCLRAQQKWMFSLVIAALCCIQVPFGTVLGVFTIVVLQRPTVKRLYGILEPTPPPPQDGW